MNKLKLTMASLLTLMPAYLYSWPGDCAGGYYGGGGPFSGHGFFNGGGLFMIITTILLLAGAGFLGYMFYKGQYKTNNNKETPLEILKARFARGEITKEQFHEMKEELS